MILTHLSLFSFLNGAGTAAASDIPILRERSVMRFVFARVFGRVN